MVAMIVRHSATPVLYHHSQRRWSQGWQRPCVLVRRRGDEGVRTVGAAVAMTALRYEGNSVRYGDISGLVDQSEVHVDVQLRGPSMLVFSGGTAFNGVVEELKKLTTRFAHVLSVSDDGGSTAEIMRVLGSLSYPKFFHLLGAGQGNSLPHSCRCLAVCAY